MDNGSAGKVNRNPSKTSLDNNHHSLIAVLRFNLVYIDGTDAASEGTFVSNFTGRNLTYTNWYGGEPNNFGDNENCVHTYAERDGTWNDVDCSTYMPSVCEIERREFIETSNF